MCEHGTIAYEGAVAGDEMSGDPGGNVARLHQHPTMPSRSHSLITHGDSFGWMKSAAGARDPASPASVPVAKQISGRLVAETGADAESQVDYGDGPMVRPPPSG